MAHTEIEQTVIDMISAAKGNRIVIKNMSGAARIGFPLGVADRLAREGVITRTVSATPRAFVYTV